MFDSPMCGQELSSVPDAALAGSVLELFEVLAGVHAELARRLVAVRERGAHLSTEVEIGSVASWLRREVRLAPAEAQRMVRRARALEKLPALREILASGETTTGHVDAVVPITELLPEGCLADVEDALVEAAVVASVKDLGRLATHVRHRVDPDGVTADAMRHELGNRLTISPFGDGTVAVNGTLSPLDGAALVAALEPLSVPNALDTRSLAERRSAALGELARRQLEAGELPVTAGVRPQVTVVVPLTTLQNETGSPAAHLVGGMPFDALTAQALACDAQVTRLVHDDTPTAREDLQGRWKEQLVGLLPAPLAAPSVVLDLGRTRRTATPDQRRALIVRDGGCVHPRCGRDPSWCEVHHLDEWWAATGETNLDRLALLCRQHHHELHRQGRGLRRKRTGPGSSACLRSPGPLDSSRLTHLVSRAPLRAERWYSCARRSRRCVSRERRLRLIGSAVGDPDDLTMTVLHLSYVDRPTGPSVDHELLCPCCGGLLALGWVRGPDAVAVLGQYIGCLLCRTLVPVGGPAVAGTPFGLCSSWPVAA